MATQVWFRNPSAYIREIVEEQASRVAWDRGFTEKRRIDVVAHAAMYFPDHIPFRILHIGPQGSAEYRKGDPLHKPSAVYPTWEYGEDIGILEEMMNANIVESDGNWDDPSLPPDERPVLGQEHRVVVTNFPGANVGPGRKFLRQIMEMQEEYPDCILHVHGIYSYRLAFGLGFKSADMECRTVAHKGGVVLPNGKEMKYEQTRKCPQWVSLLGFDINSLDVPRNRCRFNIRSALWAGENFQENIKFKTSGTHVPDTTSAVAVPATTSAVRSPRLEVKEGDKFLCDTCSLQNSCKYYRSGGVCSIPDSEPASLARYFKTRDSDTLIDGLGTLLATQTRRLERGLEDEEDVGELDPEVTKIINSLFANGAKLAKLINPALNGGPKVGVFVNGGNAAVVTQATPKAMVAAVVAELEGRGIPRDRITPEMIEGVLAPSSSVIDATVIDDSMERSA